MGEFSSQAEQKNKTATLAPVPEEISSTGELEYVDTRASTAQLISLQAAADVRSNRSTTAQLQAKALSHAGNSRIAQLQALSDSRPTSAKNNPIQRQENKTGLPDQLKTGMESLSGLSLSDVKVHRNSDKPAQLQAHAYAQGTDIHLEPGQEKHLPHELGHVVQQKQGRVQPTTQLQSNVNINDDAGLEKEADVLGAKAMQFKAMHEFHASQINSTPSSFSSNIFQLAPKGVQEDLEDELSFENIYPNKGNEEFSNSNRAINPAPDKIDRREDEQWPIGPKNEDGTGVAYSTDIIDQNGLDDDLWFKSSKGIEGVEATKEHLPAYEQGISSAFHVTTNERSAASILDRVDPRFHNPAGRFGGGFYVASDLQTSYAEVQAHEYDNFKEGGDPTKGLLSAIHVIEYTGAGSADLVDASSTEALADMVIKEPKKIEKKVREDARDGIVFNSTKGSGKNIVLFKNYGVLKVKGDGYTGAAEGFKKFKAENRTNEVEL